MTVSHSFLLSPHAPACLYLGLPPWSGNGPPVRAMGSSRVYTVRIRNPPPSARVLRSQTAASTSVVTGTMASAGQAIGQMGKATDIKQMQQSMVQFRSVGPAACLLPAYPCAAAGGSRLEPGLPHTCMFQPKRMPHTLPCCSKENAKMEMASEMMDAGEKNCGQQPLRGCPVHPIKGPAN